MTIEPTTWRRADHGPVAVVRYDRPPENLLGFAQLAELDALLHEIAKDSGVKVVVLTGAGRGCFVGHADVGDVERLVAGTECVGSADSWGAVCGRLAEIPQPVVAAVDGQAWGGGCELALAAQLRVAAASAHFRFVEVDAGAMPGAGGTQRLPRLIGSGRAALMVLGGGVVPAQQALQWGLVEAVLPDEDFPAAVLAWLEPIARQPRHALIAAKRALVDGEQMPIVAGLAYEQRLFRTLLRSDETRELFRSHGSRGTAGGPG